MSTLLEIPVTSAARKTGLAVIMQLLENPKFSQEILECRQTRSAGQLKLLFDQMA